ncbi:DUF1428 domain-containing protein [Cereibacter sphaeroides]|jgi:uncharacterized protein YbaA (DUF1428 family)|uniref:DUF1428 domain-containing protein n=1 Tax=Cereibacter sphaeroides TaxID=1063 RepID=UPI0000663EA6|nr:protein of unknown function DUF1428 [Cereibacter sphaeroides ATCC 17029]
MPYVDGFVCAVPVENRQKYIDHALFAARKFKEVGALQVVECWGDDVPEGKLTSFRMAVKQEEGEAAIFSWVVWPSKEVRNAAWQKMMEDTEMAGMEMPFDGKRMIYGGFEQVVEV